MFFLSFLWKLSIIGLLRFSHVPHSWGFGQEGMLHQSDSFLDYEAGLHGGDKEDTRARTVHTLLGNCTTFSSKACRHRKAPENNTSSQRAASKW